MVEKVFNERMRRGTALFLLVGGWLTTITLVTLRSVGDLGTQWGSLVILTAGVAIAATVTRSRMRLKDTILETYKAGLDATRITSEEKVKQHGP